MYNLIQNAALFDPNYKRRSSVNQYFTDDKGTPFTAIRIGGPKKGINGLMKVDGELKTIAFDDANNLHFFKAKETVDGQMLKPFLDDMIGVPFVDDLEHSPLAYKGGEIGNPETKRFNGSEPFPVKLTITIDNSTLHDWFGGDLEGVGMLAELFTNLAARMYKDVNVNLTLYDFYFMDVPFEDSELTLEKYIVPYALKHFWTPEKDFHHLYHGLTAKRNTKSTVIGKAVPKGVCSRYGNLGVSSVTHNGKDPTEIYEMAVTMTHEIGHNLFIDGHDGVDHFENCTCDDPDEGCVMQPGKADTATWSSCSIRILEALATDIGSDPNNCHPLKAIFERAVPPLQRKAFRTVVFRQLAALQQFYWDSATARPLTPFVPLNRYTFQKAPLAIATSLGIFSLVPY